MSKIYQSLDDLLACRILATDWRQFGICDIHFAITSNLRQRVRLIENNTKEVPIFGIRRILFSVSVTRFLNFYLSIFVSLSYLDWFNGLCILPEGIKKINFTKSKNSLSRKGMADVSQNLFAAIGEGDERLVKDLLQKQESILNFQTEVFFFLFLSFFRVCLIGCCDSPDFPLFIKLLWSVEKKLRKFWFNMALRLIFKKKF